MKKSIIFMLVTLLILALIFTSACDNDPAYDKGYTAGLRAQEEDYRYEIDQQYDVGFSDGIYSERSREFWYDELYYELYDDIYGDGYYVGYEEGQHDPARSTYENIYEEGFEEGYHAGYEDCEEGLSSDWIRH